MPIQVIPPGTQKRTFGQKLGAGVGRGLEIGGQLIEQHKEEKRKALENQQLEQLTGKDISGFTPELKKTALGELLKGKTESAKKGEDLKLDKARRDTVEKYFGPEAAEIYEAAPEGGKTAIVQSLIENAQRGQKFGDLISSQRPNQPSEPTEEKPSGIKAIDYDKGLTPKERVERQEKRYTTNLPLYEEVSHKLDALSHEQDSLETLAELSPKIGGWARLNINPSTGALIIPAAASPEAQRFVKTVNDFTVNAKDSFGARVSNFELDRFMQRLPTLANSVEGRDQIIKQMQIINKMNLLKNKAVRDVIEEHGGVRNIDFDQAERMAEKHVSSQIQALKKEFRSIDSKVENQYEKVIQDKKKRHLAPGRVMVEKDGKHFSIPKKQLKDALQEGYKPL